MSHVPSTIHGHGPQAVSTNERTTATMRRLVLALVTILLLLTAAISPAAAYDGAPRFSKGTTIRYCFSGMNSTWQNTAVNAIEAIDSTASALELNWVSWGNAYVCDVHIRAWYADDFDLMRTNMLTNSIDIDLQANWWYFSANNQCVNTPVTYCQPDFKTAIMHEFMHVLGFHHPAGGYCNPGYWTWEAAKACSPYGYRVMYGAAADGYRRALSYDDTSGINAWYDW